ncbi:RepB family plasmid replication initiator protein [Cytophagales bacterium RKSG123]|nr:RepB family plasmid replication initiator protein [Xanthovirga aplysinae]
MEKKVIQTKDFKLVKSNKLVESRSGFTLTQQRAILLAMVQIQPEAKELGEYKVFISDVLGLERGEKIKGAQYKQVRESLQQLTKTSIDILDSDEQWESLNFISHVKKVKGEDFVTIKFSTEVKDFLIDLKEKYTKYSLINVSHMKKVHSIRLYELCKQYEKIGRRKIELGLLKEMLYLNEKRSYDRVTYVKSRVIDPAVKEINENSDLIIAYEAITSGNKVTHFLFAIKKKPSMVLTSDNSTEGSIESGAIGPDVEGDDNLWYEKLKKKYDKDLLDFSIEKIESLQNVKNKRGYLIKAMKHEYFLEEFREEQKRKNSLKLKKQERIIKKREEDLKEKINKDYDNFRRELFDRFLGQANDDDLEEFLFEIEDSEEPIVKRFYNEFNSGKPSSLAQSHYAQWLIKRHGNGEEKAMLDINNYIDQYHKNEFIF